VVTTQLHRWLPQRYTDGYHTDTALSA